MTTLRIITLYALLAIIVVATGAQAQEKQPEITEKQFWRASLLFMEDPLGESAKEYAKAILVFTSQTPKAAVFLGEEEMRWVGKDDQRGLLLFTAYIAGNTQSQLRSGVKRNDRYAGLLHLFHVYRGLQERDKEFKIAEVEELLKLHREGQLVKHLLDLEAKKPTKLTPEDEEALRKLREIK